jgi:hypothetical protein
MWNRSAKNKETGKFAVVCTDWNGKEFFKGDFDTVETANAAGQDAERRMTLQMQAGTLAPLTAEEIALTDDEILAELSK